MTKIVSYFGVTINCCGNRLMDIAEFQVGEGETTFISGQPSCGKTVLLNTLSHSKFYDNHQVNYESSERKVNKDTLLINFQPVFLTNNSVMDNILLPLNIKNIRIKNRIIEMLHLFKIEHRRNDKVKTLSHSERLIVQLTRAIAVLPTILLIDDFDLISECIDREKMWLLLSKVTSNNGCIIAFGKSKCHHFNSYFEIVSGQLAANKGSQ